MDWPMEHAVHRSRGFTLVEMLVAIVVGLALSGVVMIAASRGGGVDARDVGITAFEAGLARARARAVRERVVLSAGIDGDGSGGVLRFRVLRGEGRGAGAAGEQDAPGRDSGDERSGEPEREIVVELGIDVRISGQAKRDEDPKVPSDGDAAAAPVVLVTPEGEVLVPRPLQLRTGGDWQTLRVNRWSGAVKVEAPAARDDGAPPGGGA